MINLIEFEIKKFFNRKKNLIVIALLILLSFAFIKLNLDLDKSLNDYKITSINFEMESVQNALNSIKPELERLPDNIKLKKINESYEEDLYLLNEKKEAHINNDIRKFLSLSIQMDEKKLKDHKSGDIILGEDPDIIEKEIEINSILLEKNIKPINTYASMEGLNFIKLFLNNPISIVLIIFIILLNADIVSSEYDSITFKLLFTQPISKIKILLSKIISSIIITNFIFITFIGIVFIILGLTQGFGNPEYPIEFFKNQEIQYIGMGKFILYSLISFILLINFICIFTNLISSLSKNTGNSIALSIVISVAIYMFSSKGFLSKLIHFNPFSFIDIPNILSGFLATATKNINLNFEHGIVLFIISSLILLGLNILIFENNLYLFSKKLFLKSKIEK